MVCAAENMCVQVLVALPHLVMLPGTPLGSWGTMAQNWWSNGETD